MNSPPAKSMLTNLKRFCILNVYFHKNQNLHFPHAFFLIFLIISVSACLWSSYLGHNPCPDGLASLPESEAKALRHGDGVD